MIMLVVRLNIRNGDSKRRKKLVNEYTLGKAAAT
jgi:hypothetical protein